MVDTMQSHLHMMTMMYGHPETAPWTDQGTVMWMGEKHHNVVVVFVDDDDDDYVW